MAFAISYGTHQEARGRGPPRDAAERAAARARKAAGISKAARIQSSQEVAARPAVKEPVRAPSEAEEDSETEPEEEIFSRPEPAQVIKLSAEACGNGGRFQWRGRLRGGGGDVCLEAAWVRNNFKSCVRMHWWNYKASY